MNNPIATEWKQDRKYFQLAVDAAPNAMVLVNHQGKIVLVNSHTEKLFGYHRQELVGHPVELLLPPSQLQNRPELHEGSFAQRRTGDRFPVELGMNPIETDDGTWVLISILDITERKRAEAATLECEGRFRNMANAAPVMIWVSGPDKACNFFNKALLEFTGRTMEQELAAGWLARVHPDDFDRCTAAYIGSFDAHRSFQMEYRLRRADGEYRWVLNNGVPRIAPDGVFSGYIGSCIDITDVRRTREEALASQKLESVGRVASGIAHDLNNLLGGILASAELVLAERQQGPPSDEELLRIRTAAVRGSEIVRQLMIYGGKENPAFEPVDVSSLVEEMLQLLKVSISKRASLKTELGGSLPAVHGNPAQIRQIVMNLVTNASEAIAEPDGVIRVTTAPAGKYIKLEVSDTGSGITPEVQARIFDPFFTTKFNGRGLGLAAVQGIVRGHGGAINVVSSFGQGTRFEILLPCTNQPARHIPVIAAPASDTEVGSATGTVLVVEDEDTLLHAVSKMLRMKGFSVIEAIDANTAVDLFRAHEPDIAVVLLDMTLPGLSGPQVFGALRQIRPGVKVILTTAYSEETAMKTIGGQPAWGFIRKPYQLNDLVRLLRDACLDETDLRGYAAG
jgi:two-component system cell cycle sensor histidine kinase/response regulator CckA